MEKARVSHQDVNWKRNLTQIPPQTETAVSGSTVTIGYTPILLETVKLP